jgi:hypothetical protein
MLLFVFLSDYSETGRGFKIGFKGFLNGGITPAAV